MSQEENLMKSDALLLGTTNGIFVLLTNEEAHRMKTSLFSCL